MNGSNETNFAIFIVENKNLQTIFDWDKRGDKKLYIHKGSIQFYNNEMLCPSEITKFLQLSYNESTGEPHTLPYIPSNNGYKRFCINDKINTNVSDFTYDRVTICWTALIDMPKEISYKIYYLNTTLAEILPKEHHHIERDSCSLFSWKHKYLQHTDYEQNDNENCYNLTNLDPFTKYAYFVQTYADQEEVELNSSNVQNQFHGQSAVKFFRTNYLEPSRVLNLNAASRTENSITLSWNVAGEENEIITHFLIDVTEIPDEVEKLDRRNYCEHPIWEYQVAHNEVREKDENGMSAYQCCKQCAEQNIRTSTPLSYLETNKLELDDEIAEVSKKFESDFVDFSSVIYDELFVKHPQRELFTIERRESDKKPPESINFLGRKKVSRNMRNFTIEQLKPYHNYEFKFYACANCLLDQGNTICSSYSLYFNRTLRNPDYDLVQIEPDYHEDDITQSFTFKFFEPKKQNSVVTSYNIKYAGFDGQHKSIQNQCVTRLQHQQNNFT